ncbi:MAG: potassium transporter TrkG [Planctomycetia bacterium]|nr:potassium transporter TrkG [Planctomycetia bacterium]
MQQKRPIHVRKTGTALEGVLAALAPFPLTMAFAGTIGNPAAWRIGLALAAVVCVFICAATIVRRVLLPRICGSLAVCLCIAAAFPALRDNPFLALFLGVAFLFVQVQVFDFSILIRLNRKISLADQRLGRIRGAALVLPLLAVFRSLFQFSFPGGMPYVLGPSILILSFFLLEYAYHFRRKLFWILGLFGSLLVFSSIAFCFPANIPGCAIIYGILTGLLLPGSADHRKGSILDILFDRPARVLFWSFFLLCLSGTLLLVAPSAAGNHPIPSIDAAFTAVSAVCVTGLVVLDTVKDFSFFGQFYIMILIQLGGLGIMSITTFIIQVVAKRRISLRQESMMASLTETDHHDLLSSLVLILKFTFAAEGIGAVILACAYYFSGLAFPEAVWNGTFTSISAFCNAGFTLTGGNLVGYQSNPIILYTVAFLIVLGGLAPAMALYIPAWISGRPVPAAAHIILGSTALLLFGGTLLILVFEWNGILTGLSFFDKIHNAYFQSATLRTAGFNSVPLEQIKDPTLFTMIILMFIGGSPGGTAGGIKTTTAAILILTFMTVVRHRSEVIYRYRRIPYQAVYRAVATLLAGFGIWCLFIFFLAATQSLPIREILFEITSALGTVGLTIGATPRLDEIGKMIVMAAMFLGRIGPVTLFMYLASRKPLEFGEYPDLKINLS